MSVSPVVAPVASGLVAVLLGLLGLRSAKAEKPAAEKEGGDKHGGEKQEAAEAQSAATASDARRIAGFGTGCVLAVMFGLQARTHDWFGVSFRDRLVTHKAAWKELGYDEEKARDLAAWSAAGAPLTTAAGEPPKAGAGRPEGPEAPDHGAPGGEGGEAAKPAASGEAKAPKEGAAPPPKDTAADAARRHDDGVLFTDPKRRTECQQLTQYPFADGAAAISRFRAVGGAWAKLADRAEHEIEGDAARLAFLNGALKTKCKQ
jgi:hypothetical protein